MQEQELKGKQMLEFREIDSYNYLLRNTTKTCF